MKQIHYLITTLFFLLLTLSCQQDGRRMIVKPGQEFITMVVGAKTKDCMGMYPRKCLQVIIDDSPTWQLFYDPIDGFTYEEGYEYELVVKPDTIPNPPADMSSVRYTLVKEISKTKR